MFGYKRQSYYVYTLSSIGKTCGASGNYFENVHNILRRVKGLFMSYDGEKV